MKQVPALVTLSSLPWTPAESPAPLGYRLGFGLDHDFAGNAHTDNEVNISPTPAVGWP